jgi:hypothetical protein
LRGFRCAELDSLFWSTLLLINQQRNPSVKRVIQMSNAKRFELRAEDQVWATLLVDPNGTKTLEHALTEYEVATCPGLAAYDSAGQPLNITQGPCVYLTGADGGIRLKLQIGGTREISDVVDSKGQVQLVTRLSCRGSRGNEPIKSGYLVFNQSRLNF